MENLEQLKQELTSLTERVNVAMELTNGSISLTKNELIRLIDIVKRETITDIKTEIDDFHCDYEDYIDLELNGYEISVNFDDNMFFREIKKNICDPEPTEEKHVDDLLNQIRQAN